MPRPMRFRSLRACAGLSFERFRSSGIGVHPHEVTDLPEHTGELGALVLLDRAADPAEAECPERAAVAFALPDPATRLRDLQLRHRSSPLRPRPLQPITPVPSLAGRSSTRAEPNAPRISCVIVVPCRGTGKRFFFASSMAFE